jgi:hypothetical protein
MLYKLETVLREEGDSSSSLWPQLVQYLSFVSSTEHPVPPGPGHYGASQR